MGNATPRICVVGSCNTDLTFRAPRLPRPGETLAGVAFHTGFGGKGANQAVMAALLGAAVTMVGRVGSDLFGEQTLIHLRAEGIDTRFLARDDSLPTGVAAIVVDDAGNNGIVIVPGANAALTPDDVGAAADAILTADIVLAQLETPVEATLEAFRLARQAGVRTVLNPAPAAPLPDELLRLTDLCVPNENEAEALCGLSVTDAATAACAAAALASRGVRSLLVTLGERGGVLADEGGCEAVAAVPVAAVDTTGAGDAFIGALAVAWARGASLREAARQAAAVAALSVTRHGTQASFPTRAEADTWLAQLARA
jgi:ribokinase